jgi:hypothetical protein
MKRVPYLRLILAWLFSVGATSVHAQPYTVVELSPPAGQNSALASDINNRGQVVGLAGDEVVLWDVIGALPRAVGVNGVSSLPKINERGGTPLN